MIRIVTDSSVTINDDLLDQYNISVVPLNVMIDGVLFSDSDLKEKGHFHQLMKESKTIPKTSQPSVGLFAQTYEQLMAEGADDIIAIHLSSSLSGTVEASRQGAILAKAPVTIIDSGFIDQALAFQVIRAAQLAKNGARKEEILAAVMNLKEKTELFIGVSSLGNLVKGGRINRVSGLIGSFLDIHVLMSMEDARLKTIGKGRGKKVFKKWFLDFKNLIAKRQVKQIGISYSGDASFATELAEELATLLSVPILVLETGAIIQSHAGDDAFAVMVAYD